MFVSVGFALFFIVLIFQLLFTIYAVVQALDGKYVKIPFIIRIFQ
ncbi:DUF4870 domain-containing protein [Fervidibacillus halotolerans]